MRRRRRRRRDSGWVLHCFDGRAVRRIRSSPREGVESAPSSEGMEEEVRKKQKWEKKKEKKAGRRVHHPCLTDRFLHAR